MPRAPNRPMFAGMNFRREVRAITILAALLSLGVGEVSFAESPAPVTGGAPMLASGDCPDQRRVSPKPPAKPRPEAEPGRDRPPSSLPCCKGADCTCSGPPALAATSADAPPRPRLA